MDIYIIQILSITIYKIVSLITGISLSYMGYKLFLAGIWGNAGNAEGEFGDNKLIIKKAAPGTFFVIMGAIIIGLTIIKGLNIENISNYQGTHNEKPKLID